MTLVEPVVIMEIVKIGKKLQKFVSIFQISKSFSPCAFARRVNLMPDNIDQFVILAAENWWKFVNSTKGL